MISDQDKGRFQAIDNPLIDPIILAHINLDRAVKEYDGELKQIAYDDPDLYKKFLDRMTKYQKQHPAIIVADLSQLTHLLTIEVTFPTASCAVSFLASRVAITWINARSNRSIDLKCGDTRVTIKGTNDAEVAGKLFKEITESEQPKGSKEPPR